MTAKLVVFLECDAPGCVESFTAASGALQSTRVEAEARGWRSGEFEDLCPFHAAP